MTEMKTFITILVLLLILSLAVLKLTVTAYNLKQENIELRKEISEIDGDLTIMEFEDINDTIQ